MSRIFIKNQITFLAACLAFGFLLWGLHSYMIFHFAGTVELFFPLWHIYVFHTIVATLIFTIVNYQHSKGKKEILNIFLGSTILKMILAILFLLPLILSDLEKKQPDTINFFIPYFLYLAFEIYTITQFLRQKP